MCNKEEWATQEDEALLHMMQGLLHADKDKDEDLEGWEGGMCKCCSACGNIIPPKGYLFTAGYRTPNEDDLKKSSVATLLYNSAIKAQNQRIAERNKNNDQKNQDARNQATRKFLQKLKAFGNKIQYFSKT